ncbi:3609_t:CDS:2, partial [Dentiscutata heterogama]
KDSSTHSQITEFDMDKLRSTIKQFVREWAAEGQEERDAAYKPLLEALIEFFKDVPVEERSSIRVLVPGAGLGRLAFDVVKQGIASVVKEMNFHFTWYVLLFTNKSKHKKLIGRIKTISAIGIALYFKQRIHQYEIYPFVHSFSNIVSSEDQLRPIYIPDVLPSSIPSGVSFSMVAGDFVEVYGDEQYNETFLLAKYVIIVSFTVVNLIYLLAKFNVINNSSTDQWDCIVTCFFIDTAKNILEYIEIFHRILRPGGLWINLGLIANSC